MIYCKDETDEIFVDDELNIIASNKETLKFAKALLRSIEWDFKPQNGSPTLIFANALEKTGYEIVQVELPLEEQMPGIEF